MPHRKCLRDVTDEFDGDALLHFAIRTLRQEHGPHAAFSEQPDQPIRTAASAFTGAGLRFQKLLRTFGDAVCQAHGIGDVEAKQGSTSLRRSAGTCRSSKYRFRSAGERSATSRNTS